MKYASSTTNDHVRYDTIGVAACQTAWASSKPQSGGKSKTSNAAKASAMMLAVRIFHTYGSR